MENLFRLENLKKFILSSGIFARYLQTYGESNELSDSVFDLNYLKVITSSLQLFLFKDQIIIKENDSLNCSLIEENLKKICKRIITKEKGNKLYVGDNYFESMEELIHCVRNKLAHGDFNILSEEGKVSFEHEDKLYEIGVDSLVNFSNELCEFWELMKPYGENTRIVLEQSLMNKKSLHSIKSMSKFERVLEEIEVIEIKNTPIGVFRRTFRDSLEIEILIRRISMLKKNNLPYEQEIEIVRQKLVERNIKLEFKKKKLSDFPNEILDQLKGIFISNIDNFKKYNYTIQCNLIYYWAYELIGARDTKKNILFALKSNQEMFKLIGINKKLSLVDFFKNSSKGRGVYYINQVISSYLLCFYTLYQFGLDNILKDNKRDCIEDIINMKKFDFSVLDLSKFNPNINEIENESLGYVEQFNKLKKDREELYRRLEKIEQNLEQYRKNHHGAKKIKIVSMINEIKKSINNLNLLIEGIEKYRNNNLEKHIYNRELITHLRNSIAHGNFKINFFEYSPEIKDAQPNLVFQDIHEEKMTFELKISVDDFTQLFSDDNVNAIYGFLEYQCQLEKECINQKVLKN